MILIAKIMMNAINSIQEMKSFMIREILEDYTHAQHSLAIVKKEVYVQENIQLILK
jgi:hypothetical protein